MAMRPVKGGMSALVQAVTWGVSDAERWCCLALFRQFRAWAGRPSFLKKRSKKHLLLRHHPVTDTLRRRISEQTKVFWFFFSKKNRFVFLSGLTHD
jgi:hypothetical protein